MMGRFAHVVWVGVSGRVLSCVLGVWLRWGCLRVIDKSAHCCPWVAGGLACASFTPERTCTRVRLHVRESGKYRFYRIFVWRCVWIDIWTGIHALVSWFPSIFVIWNIFLFWSDAILNKVELHDRFQLKQFRSLFRNICSTVWIWCFMWKLQCEFRE